MLVSVSSLPVTRCVVLLGHVTRATAAAIRISSRLESQNVVLALEGRTTTRYSTGRWGDVSRVRGDGLFILGCCESDWAGFRMNVSN